MKNQKENLSLPDKSNAILAEVNRKYSSLIENLQGIVFRCQNDRAYTMEFISEGCLFITGHTPQAFLKGEVKFGEIIEPDDREIVWNDVQKAIAEKRSFELAYRIRDTMGNIKHLHESGHPVFDKNGDFEALEGFINDITAQKKTEEELEKSKEQLEQYAQQGHVLQYRKALYHAQDIKGRRFISKTDRQARKTGPADTGRLWPETLGQYQQALLYGNNRGQAWKTIDDNSFPTARRGMA